MVGALAFALACGPAQLQIPLTGGDIGREMRLASADKKQVLLLISSQVSKLEKPKRSPLHDWVFEYVSAGYTRETENENFNLRLRVFNQFRPAEGDVTDYVTRMLLRLWDFNRWRLNSDHSFTISQRAVDVYLCFGGQPGAEQVVLQDPGELDGAGNPVRASNIYIYQITTLTDRAEFAREIAHEYGHATWPEIGGFTKPEPWANGDMAERVFMMWLLQEIEAGRLGTDDMMQVRVEDMRVYYKNRILPDMERVGTKGPDLALLKTNTEKAYDELIGLSSYLAASMPHPVFARSLFLNPDRTADGYVKGVIEAVGEVASWKLTIPKGLEGKAIWVPLPKGSVQGAKELRREGDWVKIQPTGGAITVTNAK
jgi:hypothetical protein